MPRFRVDHRTEYLYGRAMADGFTSTHLEPRNAPGQQVLLANLRIEPTPDELEQVTDPWGNRVTLFAVHHPHESLLLHSIVEVEVESPPLPAHDPPWETVVRAAAAATGDLALEVGPYLALTEQTTVDTTDALAALTSPEFVPGRGVVEAVRGLCGRIFGEFRFDPDVTDVSTPLATVLVERGGVCQDFAHVAVAALRSVGLPARYVSGYIETQPPPGQPKLMGVDASHAWCSVWVGDHGWVDFDPTNDQMPPQRHVTVGWGRDYHDVTPVRGVVIGAGGTQSLTVAVDVTCLD
ncbi:MAG TPA: transglutaminase [Acidimicrobiaceae bacterium]|nr:transglutaminase [Acidimicrobiaceae bacterium]